MAEEFGIKVVVDPSGASAGRKAVNAELESIEKRANKVHDSLQKMVKINQASARARALGNPTAGGHAETRAAIAHVDAIAEAARVKRLKQLDQEQAMLGQLLGPQQRYRENLATLNRLHAQGAISNQQYTSSLAALNREAGKAKKAPRDLGRPPPIVQSVGTPNDGVGARPVSFLPGGDFRRNDRAAATALAAYRSERDMLEQLRGPQQRYEQGLATLNRLKERGAISTKEYAKGVRTLKDDVGKTISPLTKLIGLLGAGFAVRKILGYADAYTNLRNRIGTVTEGTGELNRVSDELFNISQRTRSSLEENAGLFARVTTATKAMGLSQKDALQFTESLNQAIAIGGGSAASSAAGVQQLSQALGAGALRGEEFNSIMEQLPAVADVIAKGMGVTRGELRKLAEQGKITTKVIIDAFAKSKDELAAGFAKTVPTVSQRMQQLTNSTVRFVGESTILQGVVRAVSGVLGFLAEHLETIANVAGVAALAIGGRLLGGALAPLLSKMPAMLAGLKGLARSFIALAVANPFTAAIAAAGVLLSLVTDLKEIGGFLFGDGMLGGISTLEDHMGEGGILGALGQQAFAMREQARVAAESAKKQADQQKVLAEGYKRAEDMAKATLEAEKKLAEFRSRLGDDRATVQDFIPVALGGKQVERTPDQIKETKEAYDNLMASMSPTYDMTMKLAEAEKILNERYQDKEITLDEAAQIWAKYQAALVKDKTADAVSKHKELVGAFRQLEESVDPVLAAMRDYVAAQETVERAVARGITTEERGREVLLRKADALKAAADPLQTILAGLDREIELLGLTEDARQRSIELLEHELTLKEAGKTPEAIALALEEISVKQRLRDATTAQMEADAELRAQEEALLDQIQGPLRKQAETLETLKRLYDDGKISALEYSYALGEVKKAADVKLPVEEVKNLNSALVDGLKQIKAHVSDVGSLISESMLSAFKGMEDAIVTFVTTGKNAFGDLARSILNDITRILVRMALLQVGKAIGLSLPGFANGGSFDVGGRGGTDANIVAFRATRGEHVEVTTPGQRNAAEEDRGGRRGRGGGDRVRVVVQGSDEDIFEALESPRGERIMMEVFRRRQGYFRGQQ